VKLSVVIPARDEAAVIQSTLRGVVAALDQAAADFEVVVVDDGSQDRTAEEVDGLMEPRVRIVRREAPHGFGLAVRDGIAAARGDGIVVVMADASEDPEDIVLYHRLLDEGWPCVFGTRFAGGSRTAGYPPGRLVVNRIANRLIRLGFGHGHDDTTNAFKAYRREVLADVGPLVSTGFELTIELPLRAVGRGHRFVSVPIGWRGRAGGRSKFRLRSGWRYGGIVARLFLERSRRGTPRLPS